MAMTTRNLYRGRQRSREHTARFQYHNGNVDQHGNPTYSVDEDWEYRNITWPCEILSTSGGERIRGRQVTADTSHVLFGEYFAVADVVPTDRIILNDGRLFAVVAKLDSEGRRDEIRIEARQS